MELTCYTKTGCHLCEEMEQALPELGQRHGFSTVNIAIDEDDDLEARYGDKVPVLAHGDQVICQYFIDEEELRLALETLR